MRLRGYRDLSGVLAFALGLYDPEQLSCSPDGDCVFPAGASDIKVHYFHPDVVSGGAEPLPPILSYIDGSLAKLPNPEGSLVTELPGSGLTFDQTFTVTLNVTAGKSYRLAAVLITRASEFDRSDSAPGNGDAPLAAGNHAYMNFSNSALLTQFTLGGGLSAVASDSNTDYAAIAAANAGADDATPPAPTLQLQEDVTTDTTPDAFTFTDQVDAPVSGTATSAPITVQGINAAAAISVSGGEYSVNGGAFTTAPGTVIAGDTVRVRVATSANYATPSSATLTIGGVSDTFTATTLADPAATDDDGSGGCTMNPGGRFDPALWLLLAVAMGGLAARRRR